MILSSLTVGMVKVFGCRQACENRPCTNRRGGGDGLWDFGFCPAVKYRAQIATLWRTSAFERQRGGLERPPWAQNRPWRSKASSPLSTQCSRASSGTRMSHRGRKRRVPAATGRGRFEHRSDGGGCGVACATWMALCTGSALALPPGRSSWHPVSLTLSAIRQARTAASGSCAPKQVPPADIR